MVCAGRPAFNLGVCHQLTCAPRGPCCTSPSSITHSCLFLVVAPSLSIFPTGRPSPNMASTPSTSFSSEDRYARGKRARSTRSKLPSPASSDIEAHADSSDTDTDADIYRAYETVWHTFCGLPTAEYPLFQLGSQEAYERLHQKLGEHPGLLEDFENEIRKYWNSETGELRLRLMANYLHDVFQEILGITLHEELNRVAAEYPILQPFRQKIVPGGGGMGKYRNGARLVADASQPLNSRPMGNSPTQA